LNETGKISSSGKLYVYTQPINYYWVKERLVCEETEVTESWAVTQSRKQSLVLISASYQEELDRSACERSRDEEKGYPEELW
jgi:hypothetical protein